MRRVLLNDVDAATHHFMSWQDKLHTADFMVSNFFEYGLANDERNEAERAREKALDILWERYRVNRYEFEYIGKHAQDAARHRHNLRTSILKSVWCYLDRNKPPEEALEIFMGPEFYAMRRAALMGRR